MTTAIEPRPAKATALAQYQQLELDIERIADAETSNDEAAATMDKVYFFLEMAKELKSRADASMTARLKRDGKPIKCGDWLWLLKMPKRVKCASNRNAAEACFNAVAGDFDQFCALLSSDAFKHGACAKVLPPEIYDGIFITSYPDKLEKELAKVDTKYLPSRKGAGDTNTQTTEL